MKDTNGLARLYDRLTPRERLPLLVAAAARGDEQERHRLARSAPTQLQQVPDYYRLGDALQQVLLLQVARAADAAARFWRAQALLLTARHSGRTASSSSGRSGAGAGRCPSPPSPRQCVPLRSGRR